MDIWLNGETKTVTDVITVAELLTATGLQERKVAVEVNREIVPRSRHETFHLSAGDRVEIVHAIGGG